MKSIKIPLIVFCILGFLDGCDSNDVTQPSPHKNNAPIVSISSPADNEVFFIGETISFLGNGLDIEDGALPPDSLTWSSDNDGMLGKGTALTIQDLSINSHIVTLCGIDDDCECGYDTINISIIERPAPLLITSETIPQGFVCAPYNFDLHASGGTAPYTWALNASSTLPASITVSSEGKILGVPENSGSFTFNIVCTDATGKPLTVTEEFTLDIEDPTDPALAIYYDCDATVCSSETAVYTILDCYVFLILDETTLDCACGTEFMLTITDVDNNPLDLGTQYAYSYVDYPDYVVCAIGDPFRGISIAFTRGYHYWESPIQVASFGLFLFESLDNLTFNFEPDPSYEWTHPIVATCDIVHSAQEIPGRRAALNFKQQ